VRGANMPPTLIGSAARALAKALSFNSEVSQQNNGSFKTLRRVRLFRDFSLERSMGLSPWLTQTVKTVFAVH
jgi:hypothetical protein